VKISVAALTMTVALQAQTISYVASVKPNNSPDPRGFSEYYPGGRFAATAITVLTLIRNAYRIQTYQLVDAPAWFSTKRYDIVAKVDGDPPSNQVFLRALLADHFKLTVHNETRDMPRFAVVLAKPNAKPGPQLVQSDFDCAAYAATPHALPAGGGAPPCATNIRTGVLSGKAITLAQLAGGLSPFAGRFVVDRTGLTNRYDVELKWAPDQAPTAEDPSLSTALQEQLGLKLVPEKGPVNVLVVDGAKEPVAE
jgi:uncharacterized protein (TIGR03435 family)